MEPGREVKAGKKLKSKRNGTKERSGSWERLISILDLKYRMVNIR